MPKSPKPTLAAVPHPATRTDPPHPVPGGTPGVPAHGALPPPAAAPASSRHRFGAARVVVLRALIDAGLYRLDLDWLAARMIDCERATIDGDRRHERSSRAVPARDHRRRI